MATEGLAVAGGDGEVLLAVVEQHDADGAAAVGLDVKGYVEAAGKGKLSKSLPLYGKGTRMCYTHEGAVVPLQTTAQPYLFTAPGRTATTSEFAPRSLGPPRTSGATTSSSARSTASRPS